LVSLNLFRRLLKPFYKRYLDFVRSKTEAKIFYHSCGNIVGLIDDLAKIGVDIINPVQVSAMGDTAALKARFGNKVVFWGGIDTQHVLLYGSVEEVEAEIRKRISDLGPGGGFVVAPVHNIQPDVSPENILAMAEATRKFGRYPLVSQCSVTFNSLQRRTFSRMMSAVANQTNGLGVWFQAAKYW
jgi:uroporphyrinogen decarboxylase